MAREGRSQACPRTFCLLRESRKWHTLSEATCQSHPPTTPSTWQSWPPSLPLKVTGEKKVGQRGTGSGSSSSGQQVQEAASGTKHFLGTLQTVPYLPPEATASPHLTAGLTLTGTGVQLQIPHSCHEPHIVRAQHTPVHLQAFSTTMFHEFVIYAYVLSLCPWSAATADVRSFFFAFCLYQIHQNSFLVRQQLLLAALFEKWDNECSGFLDMQEVDAVLSTFKEGMEQEALNKGRRKAFRYLSLLLNQLSLVQL